MRHRRRLSAILGLMLLAMVMALPAGVAAREHHRTIPAEVLGDHVWTGTLCSGAAVSVAYHVTDRGRLVFDSVTGAPAHERGWRHEFRVRFDGTSARLFVWVHWRNGVLHLHDWFRQRPCETPPPPPVEDPNPQVG